MAYYKITKQQLIDFHQKNILSSSLLPSYQTSHKNIELMTEFLNFSSVEYSTLVRGLDDHQKDIKGHIKNQLNNYLKSAFLYIEENPGEELSINLTNFFNKHKFTNEIINNNLKTYTLLSSNEIMDLISMLDDVPELKLLNDSELKYHFSNVLTHSYLFNQEKLDNFLHIISYINNAVQTSIINIDFGNDMEISLDPILNVGGLNQSFAAKYIDIDQYIILSTSPIDIIEKSIGNVEIATESEVKVVLENNFRLDYIDLKSLQNFEKNLIVTTENISQDLDIFEHLSLMIKSDNPLTIDDFFPLFLKALDEYYVKSLKNTHEPILNSFFKYLKDNAYEDYDNFEKHYIDSIANLFKENKHYLISILSPQSNNLKDLFKKCAKSNFVGNLLNKINLVEAAFLYFDPLGSIDLEINSKTSSLGINKDIIDNGYQANIKEYENLGVNAQKIISQIVEKISQKDTDIQKQFNSHTIFNSIKQDIYPLLNLADKINYQNYSCFYSPTSRSNKYKQHHLLPLVLYDDNQIFNIFNTDLYTMQRRYGQSDYESVYAPQIIEYKLKSFLDESLLNNVDFKLDISNIMESSTMDKTIKNIINKNEITDFIDKIVLQNERFPQNKIIEKLLKKTTAIIFKYHIEELPPISYKTTLKLLPYLSDNDIERHKSKFLDLLCADKKFKIENYEDLVFNIYRFENNCVTKNSNNAVKKMFKEPKFLEKIIALHKERNTISQAEIFKIESLLLNSSYSKTIFTALTIKKIEHLGFDLLYLSPSILPQLSENIFNNETNWLNNIKTISQIYNQNQDCFYNFIIPKDIRNNYAVFKECLDLALDTNELCVKSQYGSIFLLSKFSNTFINKQENIIKVLEKTSELYESFQISKAHLDKLASINVNLGDSIEYLLSKSQSEKENYFKNTLIAIHENNINISTSTNTKINSKTLKF